MNAQDQKDNYNHLTRRIMRADLPTLYKLERVITMHYEQGLLSAKQLSKLDVKIMELIGHYQEI